MGREVEKEWEEKIGGNCNQDYCIKNLFTIKRTRKKNFKLIKNKIKARKSKAAIYWDIR